MAEPHQPTCPDQPRLPTGGRAATLAALELARHSPGESLKQWMARPRAAAVPKVLHQTWKNCTLPWRQAFWREECRRVLPDDWTLRLHTDDDNRAFIAREFPAYLELYDSYDVNIKRIDAVRYFYLYRYGGVYMDLDFTCLKPLEALPLTPGHASMGFQRFTIHDIESIANAFMVAPPRHPFIASIIHRLNSSSRLLYHSKVHPMKATGCAFLTTAVERWQRNYNNTGVLRIGHPRGYKALAADAAANRTLTTLQGAALTVHLRPRIFNSDWMASGARSHPCGCDQKLGCASRRELNGCQKNRLLTDAVVTTFWTHNWIDSMQKEVRAARNVSRDSVPSRGRVWK